MPEPTPGSSSAARVRRRATREQAGATRAAEVAARHEFLAGEAAPALCEPHLEMARTRRGIESRHLAAARMHAEHADRLEAWSGRSAEPRFLAAVASVLGVQHVGVSLLHGDRSEAVTVGSDAVATAAQDVEFTLGEGPVHDVATSGDPIAVADALVHSSLLAPESADPLDLPLLVGADHHDVVHQASGMIAEQLGCHVDDALAVLRARAFAADEPVAAIAAEVVHCGLRLDR